MTPSDLSDVGSSNLTHGHLKCVARLVVDGYSVGCSLVPDPNTAHRLVDGQEYVLLSPQWTMMGLGPNKVPFAERPSYQQRVIEECEALSDKIEKLCAFLKAPCRSDMCGEDYALLAEQREHMYRYKEVLDTRILLFDEPK